MHNLERFACKDIACMYQWFLSRFVARPHVAPFHCLPHSRRAEYLPTRLLWYISLNNSLVKAPGAAFAVHLLFERLSQHLDGLIHTACDANGGASESNAGMLKSRGTSNEMSPASLCHCSAPRSARTRPANSRLSKLIAGRRVLRPTNASAARRSQPWTSSPKGEHHRRPQA